MNNTGVGRRIKEERKRQKLTLKELAAMAGISFSYLGDIENERNNPSLSRFLDIVEALKKNPSYFIDPECANEDVAEAVKEDVSDFIPNDPDRELIQKLFEQPGFRKIIREFKYFDMWSGQEKAEILNLMRAKNQHKIMETEMDNPSGFESGTE